MMHHSKFDRLVNLKPGDRGPVWICIHALSGFIEPYRNLPNFMDDADELWGIEAKGIDGKALPERSVTAMGLEYAEGIVETFGERPCVIIGWSFGALIAHEVVTRLRALHIQALMIIIDSQKFSDTAPKQIVPLSIMAGFVETLSNKRRPLAKEIEENLSALPENQRMAALLQWASESSSIESIELLRNLYETYKANSTALVNYQVPERRGEYALLVRAEHQEGVPATDEQGWGRCFVDGMEEVVCAGDHYSMMNAEHVERLTGHIYRFAERHGLY
ncbi:thioesterase domain-containing protein [Pseudomonas syringae]|uniref:thioesterase domain-containing protein n=1 Tax=Pseudomonas syringae TaxID=317 RepID=UPI002248F774|nr:thioesterase domain-containing protein [Pseudomonas syringae]UZS66448.1 thioesterase domain-containing protein [Pseudomonas syringae]